LIVITILAALAAAVVVVLNPAELLAQARDAQRLSDMTTMRDAVNLFITQVIIRPTTPLLCSPAGTHIETGCTAGHCTFAHAAGGSPFFPATCTVPGTAAVRLINGTGWVTANLTNMHGGSPVAALPIDPVNNATFFYAFRADGVNNTFRLATRLESVRHRGMMIADGGPRSTCSTFIEPACFFEVGTNMVVGF